ncbi:MAG: COG1361 S-layer family protein [archaeon]
MKRGIIFLVILLFCLSLVSATQTVITKSDEYRIDLLRYDPSPMQPAETSVVYFEITNLGDEMVDDLEINLVESYPFLLGEGQSDKVNLNLAAGEKGSFSFPVFVNKDAEDGFYSLSLSFYSEKKGMYVSQLFTIYVQRVNRVVSATSVSVEKSDVEEIPGVLEPGEIGQVSFSVRNSADYTMKDVSVRLVLNDSSPFAPIGSTAQKEISEIAPGKLKDVSFDVIALPDALSGVYKVDLEIVYYNELGTKYTRTDMIGLVISGDPKFHVEIKDNSIANVGGQGEVTLNIVNTGLTKVKFLTVELNEGDYNILSENNVYLGDIDSDDDQSVDFILDLTSSDKIIELPLTLTFLDANNQEYVVEQSAELQIYDLEKSNGKITWIILIVLILVVGIIVYSKYRKRFKGFFKKK